jgi:hypothetical protein
MEPYQPENLPLSGLELPRLIGLVGAANAQLFQLDQPDLEFGYEIESRANRDRLHGAFPQMIRKLRE